MALNYQFNKTSLQILEKNLKVRVRALPTIKSKESALRLEVKKAKYDLHLLEIAFSKKLEEHSAMMALWTEFDSDLVKVKDVTLSVKKIAGVKIPILEEAIFETSEYNMFTSPKWFADGISLVKEMATLGIEGALMERKMELLEHARKKTTQKVNLFEKVQIPGYQDAIRKIKRFMEDEDNLSKAAQKIVKSRQEKKEAES